MKPIVNFFRAPYCYKFQDFVPTQFHSLCHTDIKVMPYLDDFLFVVLEN